MPAIQTTLPSSRLLPLLCLQRTGRSCHNFSGLGIENHMITTGGRMRLRPPVQLLQTLSHLKSIVFTSIADFTIWTVDSQQGQQVASQAHDKPRENYFFRRGVTYYGTR